MDSTDAGSTALIHPAAKGTQAIGRAAALLRELANEPRKGHGLAELADRLGLERPTVYRILRRLVDEGLVRQDPASRGYFLGELIYELGLLADAGQATREMCRPSLNRLASESSDTIFLIASRGMDCVCLDRAEGSYPVKALLLEPGQRRPTGIGAGSIALLAALPAEVARKTLQGNTRRLEEAGESIADLEDIVATAARTGYALKRPPDMPEILSLAMTVVDAAGAPLIALSISGLAHRISSRLDMLTGLLRDETRLLRRTFNVGSSSLASGATGAHALPK